jgi:hypothetical protein
MQISGEKILRETGFGGRKKTYKVRVGLDSASQVRAESNGSL